jgi:2,3-bisphosphoglycerate-dependent phosphoglycerate mutase
MTKRLILIRHGESLWNYSNLYTGWSDISLTLKGVDESKRAGQILLKNNIFPKTSYASKLIRCIETNSLILNEMKLQGLKVHESWRLNERHYGTLTGYNRKELPWKGEYFDVPPILPPINNLNIYNEISYNPKFGESYHMTYLRLMPIWNLVKTSVLEEEVPIVCSHKNTLKVLIKHLEYIDETEINEIDIPNAIPIIYDFDDDMKVIKKRILKN